MDDHNSGSSSEPSLHIAAHLDFWCVAQWNILDVLYGRAAREEPLADDLTRLYSLHFLVVLL